MPDTSMTALVSAFVRAYHTLHSAVPVFSDEPARPMLGGDYDAIAENMSRGIKFFDPDFNGDADAALSLIVNRHLSPTPLGRAAFCERALLRAVGLGAAQYIVLGAGFDTFSLRRPPWADRLKVFNIDRPGVIDDRARRMQRAGLCADADSMDIPAELSEPGWTDALTGNACFSRESTSFVSMPGLIYYLTSDEFARLMQALALLMPPGSAVAFDYPGTGKNLRQELARGAGEEMRAQYAYSDIERILEKNSFLIYEHLTPDDIDAQIFSAHNTAEPLDRICAPADMRLCLAVRR